MFDAIHLLHQEAKLLHKDIKLDNFRIQQGQVKLIDFGIVAEYQDKEGVHYPQYDTSFQGTPLTGSIAALEGKNHSRRDDLEGLAYTFMFMFDQSKIAWASDTEIKSIADNKRQFLADHQNEPLEF